MKLWSRAGIAKSCLRPAVAALLSAVTVSAVVASSVAFAPLASAASGITYLATKTQYLTEGTGQSTVSIPFTPGAVGDLVIVNVSTDVTAAGKPSAISDTAGHIAWAPRVLETLTTTDPRFFTVWVGTVTATGATSIKITWTGGSTGHKELTVTSWRSGYGATTKWSVVSDTSYAKDAPSGTFTMPPLTSTTGSTQFYWCDTIADGSSSGASTHQGVFTYLTDPYSNAYAYRLALAPDTSYSPKINYTNDIGADAMILQASSSSSGPPPLPTVTKVSPTSGPTTGGTTVTITGTNLSGETSVKFGTATATVTADTSTKITATSPTGSAGTVNVTVTTKGGTSATSAADQFTYVAPPLPTVTKVSPTSGPTTGGTTVTITGTNLSGETSVKFGTATATVTADTSTKITATSPTGSAGTVNVTVTTKGGTSATSAADQFTYVAPPLPTVTKVSPTSGPTTGGTTVTITGTNLSGETSVKFGTATATVTADTSTKITATSPTGSAGTVNVTVTTKGGTSATSAADQFTYVAPPLPTVTKVSPTSGPTTGGTTVTITGTNLSGETSVKFGTATATVTADTSTKITATSPTGSAGTVNVTVTTKGGTSATSTADQFTYVTSAASGITYLATKTQYLTEGTGQSTVSIPFTPGAVGDLVIVNVSTDVTAAGKPSAISDTAGHIAWAPRVLETLTTTDPRFFTVWVGTVTATGATSIKITWTGGSTGHKELTVTSWRSGYGATTKWSVVSDTSYAKDAPSGTFTMPPLTSTTGSTQFYWCDTIADGSSSGASTHQGVFTYLTDPYSNAYAYRLALAPDTSYSPKINYTNDIGADAMILQASSSSSGPPPLPTVTKVSPTSGPTTGGTTVTITGTNLSGETSVKFGTATATVTADSATTITAVSPTGSAGTVNVTVTTKGGTSATSTADQFTYVAPPLPTVTKVSPTSGPTTGGTTVTITGTNLSGETSVKFGTATATVTADTSTKITATSPTGSAGTVNVTVTTKGGTSATSTADQFTYVTSAASGITYLATKTQYLTEGTGQSTVSIPFTPGAVGDLVIVNVSTDVTAAGKPSAISDTAGHIAWAPRVLETLTTTDPRFFTVWVGTVTATGATSIKITWTGGSTGHKELTVTSWRSGYGATTKWSVVSDTSYAKDAPSGTFTMPPLTSTTGSTQFYWCDTIADGSSSGASTHQGVFTYLTDPYSNAYAYRLALAPDTSYSPKINYTNDIGADAMILQAS